MSSEIARIEIDANSNRVIRSRARLFLPDKSAIIELTEAHITRARVLETLGFKAADALHVASAESLAADVLLSCDDRLCKLGRRHHRQLLVKVANPVDWLQEIDHGADSG